MSTNCPPQLHLTLPSNATSFKRSFEQFGFDLESPVGSAEGSSTQSTGSGSDGNDRNKRARSASTASHSSGTIENSSQSTSSSASSSAISVNEVAEGSGLTTTRPPALTLSTPHRHSYPTRSLSFLEAPRLPTPDLHSIVMSDFPSVATPQLSSPISPIQPATTGHDERYRISLERFNAFDNQISALRQSHSPSAVRSPTPPPILPPLTLSSDSEDHDSLHILRTSTDPTHVPLLPDLPDNDDLPFPSRSQLTGRDATAWEHFESRLERRVWPHGHDSTSTSAITESRAPLTDPPRRGRSPSFASSRVFTSLPRTVAREDSSTMADFPTTISRSRPSRARAEPGEHTIIRHQHTIFRDRLDSALDVLRSSSPLFSDPFTSRHEGTSPMTVLHSRAQDDVGHNRPGAWSTQVLRPSSARDPRSVFGHRTTDSSGSTRFRLSSDGPTEDITETQTLRVPNPISQLGSTTASFHRIYPRTRSSRVGASNSLVAENAAELRQQIARAQLTLEFSDDRSPPLDDPSDDEAVWYDEPHPRFIRRRSFTETIQPPHRETSEYRGLGLLRMGHSSNVNTSTPFPRASISTGGVGDTFDPITPSSRNHYHSHAFLWNHDRASPAAEGNRAAPTPPSGTLFDTYVPSFADGLTSFEPTSGRHSQESDVPTTARTATLLASASSTHSRGEFGNPARQHLQTSSHVSHRSHSPSPPFSLPMPDLTGFYPTPFHTMERNHSPSLLQSDMNPDSQPNFRSRLSGASHLPSPSPEREPRPFSSSARLPGSNQTPTYRNIDLNTYHDGPFRASLQRFVESDRVRSRTQLASGSSDPPSIPPLRFEDDFSPFNGGEPEVDTPSAWGPPLSRRDPEARQERVELIRSTRTGIDQHEDFLRERRSVVTPSRSRPIFRTYRDSVRAYEGDAQDRRDVYSFLNRQHRIEASRIETEEIALRRQGPVEAIDMLRGDRRNSLIRQQQLIEHFQREHSQSQERRRTTASFWGDVEGESEGFQFFPSRPRYSARARATHLATEPFGPARSYPTAPGPTSRHRPSSRSPVRDDSTAHARLLARARHQGRRRLDNESIFGDVPRMDASHASLRRRGRTFGDYMRDEDFDSSYENLLSIATALGEAKSRGVPEHVITSLPTGFYKDWATTGSDHRCPICLDDYKSLDRVLKLSECSHWLHKGCLEQWLRGASTCPVCRKCVNGTRGQNDDTSDDPGASRRNDDDDGGEGGSPRNSIPPWGYSLRRS